MKMFRIALLIIASVLFLRAPLYADSQQIRRDFFAQIEREKNFGGYSLDIEVIAGVVTARGNVTNAISKARVSEIALALKGVRRVINEVEVVPTTQAGAQPHSIAQLITERTRRELTSEGYTLNVLLEGKDVILQGTVDTVKGARQIVAIAESSAPGSIVRNQLVVKEEVLTDSELRSRVLKALALDEQIRTDDLTIRAENGVIYIAGSRPEHRSIDRILSTVIMVDGVKDVKSSVLISKQ